MAFFYVVIVLVTHHITHLSVATCALMGALIALLLGGQKMGKVLERIDYPTVAFFAGLFIIVGAMEHVGLLKMAATVVKEASGANFFIALSVILRISTFGSSIVDNVPFYRNDGADSQAYE